MSHKKLSKKQVIAIATSSSILGVGALATSTYFIGYKIYRDNRVNYYNNIISNINNLETKVSDEFIKGADISSYAEIAENLLFEHNIKKSDGSWYTYKDIANPNNTVWDDKTKQTVSLEQYINNNLYSYFDENSNRIYDNLFTILKKKGITTLRIRFWVDPYDKNGNSYGGGHNDLDTNIFIMQQAKKYGFDDFLLVFHYSDFWADPNKHYMPKSWEDKTDEELLKISYDYTKNILDRIYDEVGIVPNKVQYGNEISKGFLDVYNKDKKKFITKSFDFLSDFIIESINSTNDFLAEHPGYTIDKNIHIEGNTLYKNLMRYQKAAKLCDSIQFSFYMLYGNTMNTLPEQFRLIRNEFPDKDLYMGELSLTYTGLDNDNINEFGMGHDIDKDWTPEAQALIMFQHMQLLSKLLPEIKTGFYWWEIGQLYIGRLSWATKAGIEYFQGENYKTWKDINNWSSNICFDKNAIALPVLDVINNFERNIDSSKYNVYDPKNYFKINLDNALNYDDLNYFLRAIKFLWPKDFIKKDLSKILYNKVDESAQDKEIDIEIYLNNKPTKITSELLINEIKKQYFSLMFNQINFSDFSYDENTKIGQIKLSPTKNSFYYDPNTSIILKFKVYPENLINTIDLTHQIIQINKNDNLWYKKIISFLKNQKTTGDFGTQIWDYLKITGGGNDDDSILLYDNNKNVNRNVEFFLLSTDQIRRSNNKVDYDVLKEVKMWIDNFSNYQTGSHDIYFAIRKSINDIDWENSTDSTYSQVGAESWRYIDLLIYKLRINLK
ncbi:MAG: arabinogalactan endo-1,4-beta-galactosidase [Ureaplasma sp.]|nr:arabinogalactan endo-1,4-beta-galactosidase [Ureaplasma sp.]